MFFEGETRPPTLALPLQTMIPVPVHMKPCVGIIVQQKLHVCAVIIYR